MSRLRKFYNVLRGERLSREIDREMSFHVAERADDLVVHGYTEAEAMREAKRRFGNEVVARERTRDVNLFGWMETLISDVRYGLRSLLATPGFAMVAILSLGLGIGANAAIFNLVDAVMLRTLPVMRPEELAQVKIGDSDSFSNAVWEGLRDRQDMFTSMFAYGSASFNLANGGVARRASANWVSGAFFTTLGVRPAAGRLLQPSDEYRGCAPGAVLSYALWQREYGGDRAAIGKSISLDGTAVPIIGVADASFFGMNVGRPADLYVPLCSEPALRGANSFLNQPNFWFLRVDGRMKPGVTLESANARLGRLAPAVMQATLPPRYKGKDRDEFLKKPLSAVAASRGLSYLRADASKALMTLMGIVALVLLIACANVANLLLARATVRQREMAVRLAIGASRGRIVRQMLTESLLLSFLGAATGVFFASWGAHMLVRLMSTASEPISLQVGADWRVLLFATAVAFGTGILFGVAPALRGSRAQPQSVLKANSRSVVEGHSRFSAGKALVVAQIALSLTLVTGAGLLLGTFRQLTSQDLGFHTDGVLLANLDISGLKLAGARQQPLYKDVLARARALPGVQAASISVNTPVSSNYWATTIVVDGFKPATDDDARVAVNKVTNGYFATLGTRLIAGRDFNAGDVPGSPLVTVVNEELARKFFGTANPIGKRIGTGSADDPAPWREVVGVVANTKYGDLREDVQPIFYQSLQQDSLPGDYLTLSMRTNASASALLAEARTMLHDVNPDITVDFAPLGDQIAQSLLRDRMLALLSAFFGALALLLAVIGLYGIMSYSVARRRNEIGIRIALGSARERVMAMVLGEVGRLVGVGVVIGTMVALAATKLVKSFLFGVQSDDPRTLLLSCALLAAVAIGAGALPAWRAARLDPMTALREE